jgi:hypothetical protein
MKDIRVEVPQQMPPQRKGLRLKPAGWLAVGVLGFLVVVLLGYAYQQIYWATHGIETLPTMAPVPTYTPAPTPVPPTPTPGPTPTPEGWSRGWDPVTKREYLVPPPEVEQKVREAFNAVLAAVVVEDQSDEALRRYDLEKSTVAWRNTSCRRLPTGMTLSLRGNPASGSGGPRAMF